MRDFGPSARLTKAGCAKQREDGSVKARLIFDGRRSGINGMIVRRERVNLPRISDVARGFQQLLSNNGQRAASGEVYAELFALDFKDAFNLLQLRQDERSLGWSWLTQRETSCWQHLRSSVDAGESCLCTF